MWCMQIEWAMETRPRVMGGNIEEGAASSAPEEQIMQHASHRYMDRRRCSSMRQNISRMIRRQLYCSLYGIGRRTASRL
jgi:hypothetical protein